MHVAATRVQSRLRWRPGRCHYRGSHFGAQEVVNEGVGEFPTRTLAEDHGIVSIKAETLFWERKREPGGGGARLSGDRGPGLSHQHIASDHLVPYLCVEVSPQERFLCKRFPAGGGQFRRISGVNRFAELFEAHSQHLRRVVQHCLTAAEPGIPQIAPCLGCRGGFRAEQNACSPPGVRHT